MYVVTNRQVNDSKSGLDKSGNSPNENGNYELRLARLTRRGRLRK